MARLLFEVGFCRAMFDANPIGNGATLELVGIIVVPLPLVRELLIQLSASLTFLMDIAIERVLADGNTKLQAQTSTDDLW